MSRRLAVIALLLVSMLVLAACGSEDPTPTPKPAATPTPTSADSGGSQPDPTPTTPDVSYDFSGKTITVVVMYSPGGGYDAVSRVVSRFLGKHLPGEPRLIVQNRPGAGGVIGTNYAYTTDPDGETLVMFPTDIVLNQVTGQAGVEYDFQQFQYVGALDRATKACYFRTDKGIDSVADTVNSSEPLFVGGSGGGGDLIFSALMAEELGSNFSHVLGYQGTADTHIAIEAGEVDGRCTTWSTVPASNPSWFETDPPLVTPVMQFTIGGEDPALPGVETAEDFKDQFSELGWQSLLAAMLPLQTYRTFALPPGAEQGLVDVYREAFTAMYESQEFIDAMAAANRPLVGQAGADVQRLLTEEIVISDEVQANLIRLLATQ